MAYTFHNEGEAQMLDVYVRGNASNTPAGFFIGLCGGTLNVALGDSVTLTSLTGEPTAGTGYLRQAVARTTGAWTLESDNGPDGGDQQVYNTAQVTFTNTSTTTDWASVTKAFLATTSDNSGKLIASVDLSTTRTLKPGDSLKVTFKLKLS